MPTKPTKPTKLVLTPGHFYKSRAGDVWCCFRVSPEARLHAQADCVAVEGSGRSEYFYRDGRYDAEGKSDLTLVEECGPRGETMPAKSGGEIVTEEHGELIDQMADAGVPQATSIAAAVAQLARATAREEMVRVRNDEIESERERESRG